MREWYLVNGSSFGTFAPRTQGLFLVPSSKKIPGHFNLDNKVENILKGSLDSIPSPTPSLKNLITGGTVWLRCEGKTLLGIENKKFVDITQ